MIEVEVKIPVTDLGTLTKKLERLSFVYAKEVQETDMYYTGSFHDMRKHDEALRIRHIKVKNAPELNRSLVTFKGPKLDNVSMSRTEFETEIKDPEIMNSILNALEYYEAGVVAKKRIYYTRDQITVCVDTVENLGTFMEAEILAADDSQRASALNELKILLSELDLNFENTVTTSYLSMLQKKNC